jgi:serine protease inhibitor
VRTWRCLILLMVAAACSNTTDPVGAPPRILALPRALTGAEQAAIAANTRFGLALFREVNRTTARDSNLVLSPLSASMALGMAMNGARNTTLVDMARVLGFETTDLSAINAGYRDLIPMLRGRA